MTKKPSTRSPGPAQPAAEPSPEAAREAIRRELNETREELRRVTLQVNLANAVALAEQAERGEGPLIDLFAELGERYAHLLDKSDD
jgi:hypothetical protein